MKTKTNRVVLVVEDDPTISRAISRLIKGEGHIAVTAFTAGEALSFLETSQCDLITLDLKLPDRHGNTVLEELTRTGIETPVIIVSASPEELVASKQVRAVITKPFIPSEFLQMVRQQLGQWLF